MCVDGGGGGHSGLLFLMMRMASEARGEAKARALDTCVTERSTLALVFVIHIHTVMLLCWNICACTRLMNNRKYTCLHLTCMPSRCLQHDKPLA